MTATKTREDLARSHSFLAAMRLRCPHCQVTPFLRERSWFEFREGCEVCDYPFEREEGYFSGAAWMVSFSATAIMGLAMGALLLWLAPQVDALVDAILVSFVMVVFAFWFMPYSRALWLWADHWFHPIEHNERLSWRRLETGVKSEPETPPHLG